MRRAVVNLTGGATPIDEYKANEGWRGPYRCTTAPWGPLRSATTRAPAATILLITSIGLPSPT